MSRHAPHWMPPPRHLSTARLTLLCCHAKHLAVLENAKSAGFGGEKGFADVLALYEVAASVAGTADEGATNTNDLISELSSVNLANSANRVKINGKRLNYKSMALKDAQRATIHSTRWSTWSRPLTVMTRR